MSLLVGFVIIAFALYMWASIFAATRWTWMRLASCCAPGRRVWFPRIGAALLAISGGWIVYEAWRLIALTGKLLNPSLRQLRLSSRVGRRALLAGGGWLVSLSGWAILVFVVVARAPNQPISDTTLVIVGGLLAFAAFGTVCFGIVLGWRDWWWQLGAAAVLGAAVLLCWYVVLTIEADILSNSDVGQAVGLGSCCCRSSRSCCLRCCY